MKKRLLVTALLLSACSQLPDERKAEVETLAIPAEEIKPSEPEEVVVENDAVAESLATDFEHIFVDTDMTFSGTLPCADCPGISYHINLFRDGRFAVRQEYLERNQVSIIRGIWLLEKRSLHLVNQQQTLPAFHFVSNTQLAMLDLSGKPITSNTNYQLQREAEFRKLDTRQAMLGLYTLSDSQASFTSCASGETLTVANTQHHLPVMRQYQQDERLKGNSVIATLLGRRGQDDQSNTLFIDKFEQVTDKDGAVMARRIAKEEGLFCGYSAGSCLQGLQLLKTELKPTDVVVCIFHDHGSRYVGKIYNDEWMMERGFLDVKTFKDIVSGRAGQKLITVSPDHLIAEAVALMKKYDIEHIPVMDVQNMVGSLSENGLFQQIFTNPDIKNQSVGSVMEQPYPVVDFLTPVEKLGTLINQKNGAVIAKDEKGDFHIVTKYDVIQSLTK